METLLIITNVGEHVAIMPSEYLLSLKEDERTKCFENALHALYRNDYSFISVDFDEMISPEAYERFSYVLEEIYFDFVKGFLIGFKSRILPLTCYIEPELSEFYLH